MMYFIDLPGYGYARVSQTQRRRFAHLIEAVLSDRPKLAGVVWLLDIRRDPGEEDLLLGDHMAAHQTPILAAVTKGDKLSRQKQMQRARSIGMALSLPEDQIVITSAVTKDGIDTLRDTIRSLAEACT
jgi:GTP-binding protein